MRKNTTLALALALSGAALAGCASNQSMVRSDNGQSDLQTQLAQEQARNADLQKQLESQQAAPQTAATPICSRPMHNRVTVTRAC